MSAVAAMERIVTAAAAGQARSGRGAGGRGRPTRRIARLHNGAGLAFLPELPHAESLPSVRSGIRLVIVAPP